MLLRGRFKGNRVRATFAAVILAVVAVPACFAQATGNIGIKDFSGQIVDVPLNVKRVACIHPIFTYMAWRIAADSVVSVDKVFKMQYLSDSGLRVFSDKDLAFLKSLPVTGVFFSGVDPEQILGLRPDVLVTITNDANINKLKKQLGIPVLVLSKSRIQDYEESFRMLGMVMGARAQADRLADYWHGIIASFEHRPEPARRPSVLHIATGGITSVIGEQTIMGSIIKMAGGKNVSAGLQGDPRQETIAVSLEQIVLWNPDIIVTQNDEQRRAILSDPAWSSISAVKAKRVYAQLKYAKVDGLTSLMGLKWYDIILNHPEERAAYKAFDDDMREFYSVFYQYDITNEQLAELQG